MSSIEVRSSPMTHEPKSKMMHARVSAEAQERGSRSRRTAWTLLQASLYASW
jgi:hypothetical protein